MRLHALCRRGGAVGRLRARADHRGLDAKLREDPGGYITGQVVALEAAARCWTTRTSSTASAWTRPASAPRSPT